MVSDEAREAAKQESRLARIEASISGCDRDPRSKQTIL